ncbi:hypothetical protein SAMN05421868_104132 [Paenibacillus naphthalenovorans]|nr:hypothetical protein SAMN05421868_104132 [Paenibacillus naphthalenovorans]
MKIVKINENNHRFNGLIPVILILTVVICSPFLYFLIQLMLGNEADFIYHPFEYK